MRDAISAFRSALVVVLAVALMDVPVVPAGAQQAAVPAHSTRAQRPLTREEQVRQGLNRLTFGPKPGEVAAVTAMGFERWFERQLDPASIDDAALERRLDAFPAMRLPQAQLIARFPSKGMLRAVSEGKLALPADPETRAIYRHSIDAYEQRQAMKAAGKAEDGAASAEATAQAGKLAGEVTGEVVGAMTRTPRRLSLLAPSDFLSNSFNLKKPGEGAAGPNEVALPGQRGRSVHAEALYPGAATTALLALAPGARVTRLLALRTGDLTAFRRSLSTDELRQLGEGLSPAQKETLAALGSPTNAVTAEVLASRLERDVYTERQVQAVMTDFWLNHFNVFVGKNQEEPALLPAYERETIRPYALGRFENLLVATASSPAMLVYLDNAQSVGPHSAAAERAARNPKAKGGDRGLNENYARELMELHTLGVQCEASKDHAPGDASCGAGYTQADITEVARVLSGWTVERPALGGQATYDERRHEPGTKHVLGTTIQENGEREGLELLHRLATSPATARFISTKLAVRFVSDDPPAALIDRMTEAWMSSQGDIRTVLRAMVHSPEFMAPAAYGAKVKTPLEFVVSALRASDAEISNPAALVQSLNRMGMPMYGMQTPNGYSWLSEPWVSTAALVTRMNFALVLADNRLPGTRIAWPAESAAASLKPVGGTGGDGVQAAADSDAQAAAEERQLERALVGGAVSERTRATILAQSRNAALPEQARQQMFPGTAQTAREDAAGVTRASATMAGLLLGSPEFQRR